jgi:hypothetical protein
VHVGDVMVRAGDLFGRRKQRNGRTAGASTRQWLGCGN